VIVFDKKKKNVVIKA